MAITPSDRRTKPLAPRNTRLNEIVAIALSALGVLLLLCLVYFNPNDNSLNSVGGGETRNLVGPVGAYVADALLQTFGLAAHLLPLLLFALAWRRFRTSRLHAPLLRVVGLIVTLLASSSLLALFIGGKVFSTRIEAGGAVGVFF